MKNIRYLMIGFIAVFIISGLFGCGEQAFFPTENSGDLKYAIRYLFTEETMGSAETNLDIDQIEIYNNAKVISVSLPQLSGIPEERLLLGYFLVEGNSIRKLNTGYMERLDREYLNDTIKMEELLREASIVCQDEPITDPLNQNEKGRHQALTVNGNRR